MYYILLTYRRVEAVFYCEMENWDEIESATLSHRKNRLYVIRRLLNATIQLNLETKIIVQKQPGNFLFALSTYVSL